MNQKNDLNTTLLNPSAPVEYIAHINDYPSNKRNHNHKSTLMEQIPAELKQYVVNPEHEITHYFMKPSSINSAVGKCLYPLFFCKMILVRKGFVAKTWRGDKPLILGQGRHFLLSPTHTFAGLADLKTQCMISHGPIHIISVALGQLGIGTDVQTGKPVILSTGTHYINNNFFRWQEFSDLTNPVTQIGKMQIVRVEKGQVGYGYSGQTGDLQIYEPGLHFIQPPERYVDRISQMIQITQLPTEIHESKDYVEIAVKAAIYYQVADPAKALVTVQNIDREIKELGIATLQQIIRSSTLVDIAGTSKISYSSKGKQDEVQKEGCSDFYEKIHDRFMLQLHDVILEQWGIDINNIRIESLRIHDKKLAQSIANQAVQVSQLEAQHMMLAKQSEIKKVEANNKAMQQKIAVQAETNVIRMRAEADALAIVVKAKAQREAKILVGEGEAEYSNLVQKTGLGAELAKMQIQAEAIKGLDQIAYVPHLPAILNKLGQGGASLQLGGSTLMPLMKSTERNINER